MLEIMIHNMVGTVDILIDAMIDEINLFCGVKEQRAYVRPFIPDLLHFNFWILGLLPEAVHPSRHSYICGDRGFHLQAQVEGQRSKS